MNIVLIGNIVSFIGCTIMVLNGLLKNKKQILLSQCLQDGILGLANYILGGYSGVISNLLMIVRNLVCVKFNLNVPLKIFFIVLQFAITIFTNQEGILAYLPVMATCFFTIVCDSENPNKMKIAIILGEICWVIYDSFYHNYSGCIFDIITIISNGIGILLILHSKKRKPPKTNN